MYFYSESSKKKLRTCHDDLQLIFNCAIADKDITILCGHRSEEAQFALFTKGRKLVNGIWVIDDKAKIVTYKDGKEKKSEHNLFPSMAIDAAKWFKEKPHIRWNDKHSFFELYNTLNAHANFLFNAGKISHRLIWGGNWKMRDYPHFQLWKVKK
jgi:peptidoglycan L-alanyl-D-glutamate endopeptidase CwlK